MLSTPSLAGLTPAGVIVRNQATLNFTVNGSMAEVQSNAVQFTIDQLLDVLLTPQDVTAIGVNSPDVQRVLTFRLTNAGNGPESYRLTRDDALGGDDFDPLPAQTGGATLFLENGLQPGFQATGPNSDTAYVSGANDPLLRANQSQVVYLLSDIPRALDSMALGQSRLVAISTSVDVVGQAPGTGLPPLVEGDPVRVVGRSQGRSAAVGGYRITGIRTYLDKSVVSVRDPNGGSLYMPGSLLRYRLRLQLEGEGNAQQVVLSDEIPSGLRYVAGSLSLNGAPLSDASDTDLGEWLSDSNQVRSRLGAQVAPFTTELEFSAVIE